MAADDGGRRLAETDRMPDSVTTMTSTGTAATPPELIDWDAAARIAARLSPPGPSAPRAELEALVAELRSGADVAAGHVLDITGISAGRVDDGPPVLGTVHVVDRAGWARANTEVLSAMLGPVLPEVTSALAARTGAAVGSVQVGGVLAVLAGKVLGQYDPFTSERGRLLLVAPNVLRLERELKLRASDFRLWVCLHEQTHAVQFATAPWLAAYLRDKARSLLQDVTSQLPGRLTGGGGRALADAVRAALGEEETESGGTVLGALLDEEQQQLLDEVTAVMSLLEGHADVVMDEVGPAVVPTVRTIRARFDKRRDAPGPIDRVLRRLLGLDQKLAQYRNGAAFVRAVRDRVGFDGLNAVWASPGTLPRPAEIADAEAWLRRVHG